MCRETLCEQALSNQLSEESVYRFICVLCRIGLLFSCHLFEVGVAYFWHTRIFFFELVEIGVTYFEVHVFVLPCLWLIVAVTYLWFST